MVYAIRVQYSGDSLHRFHGQFFAVAGLCHPSDNVAAVLGVCEHAGRSGKEFLTALAVAYQVESMLTASAPFLARGLTLRPRCPTR